MRHGRSRKRRTKQTQERGHGVKRWEGGGVAVHLPCAGIHPRIDISPHCRNFVQYSRLYVRVHTKDPTENVAARTTAVQKKYMHSTVSSSVPRRCAYVRVQWAARRAVECRASPCAMSGDRHGDIVAFERVSRIARAPLVEHITRPSLQFYPPAKVSLRRSQDSAFQHLSISHWGLLREEEVANSRERSHWFLAQHVQHQGLWDPQGTVHGVREKSPSHARLCEYCTFAIVSTTV